MLLKPLSLRFLAFLIFVLSFANFVSEAKAAGLLAACPNGGSNCSDSQKFYPTFPSSGTVVNVLYRNDQGPLGDLVNPQMLTNDILATWNNVETSKINFLNQGTLSSDINETNFQSILSPNGTLGFTPIVFDDDGEIFESFFGQGSKASVLGFAGPTFISPSSEIIVESQAAFNGFLFTLSNLFGETSVTNTNNFKSTVLHEFGHAIGLDHTQVFLEEFLKRRNGQPSNLSNIPIMFPILANPGFTLLLDDVVSVSSPAAYAETDFMTEFGTLRGEARDSNSNALTGGNVIAFNVDNTALAVSSVVDLFTTGNAEFIIPGLPPGNYILKVEPIFSEFTGASSVGPVAPPKNPSSFTTGFFNGTGEALLDVSLEDALNNAQQITINAGQLTTINLGGATNGGMPGTDPDAIKRSFKASGKAVNNSTLVGDFDEVTSKIKFTKIKPFKKKTVRLSLSSSSPDLISFNKESFKIGKRKLYKKITATFAPLSDFLDEFPDFLTEGAQITVTATDTDSGFIDSQIILEVF